MKRLLDDESVQKALGFLKEDDDRTLLETLEMCQIPGAFLSGGKEGGVCSGEDGGSRPL